jgi:hypothetical protein
LLHDKTRVEVFVVSMCGIISLVPGTSLTIAIVRIFKQN